MATPHTGPRDYAQLIRIGIAPGTRLVGELKEGSPYLTKLRSDWDALPARPDTHCWWSSGDALVTEKSAHEGCAITHVLSVNSSNPSAES